MPFEGVQMVQYLGLLVDDICIGMLMLIMYVCPWLNFSESSWKYRVKHFVSKRIEHQLYSSFIYARINYGIEVYGSCADEHLSKLQVMQNKLLKLLPKLDYRTSTSLLDYNMTLLKIADIHSVNILSFVKECWTDRNPDIFKNYFTVREATYDFRHKDRLLVPLARTELGSSRCAILGTKLWNKYYDEVHPHLLKKSFRKRVTKSFISKYTLQTMSIPICICACWILFINRFTLANIDIQITINHVLNV